MGAYNRDEIIAALEKKGFQRREGSKHTRLELLDSIGNDLGVMTFFSRSRKDVGPGLFASVARQLGLISSEFRRHVGCEISYNVYLNLIKDRGLTK